MLDRSDTGQVGFRTGGMQDRWNAGREGSGVEGCRKGEIQEMIDANLVVKRHKSEKTKGKEGFGTEEIQDWRNTRKEGYRKGKIRD